MFSLDNLSGYERALIGTALLVQADAYERSSDYFTGPVGERFRADAKRLRELASRLLDDINS